MGKQSKPRKPESFGKGKVTPIQVAFIVDRYLCDNSFSETRTAFRNEASSLIANSPINQVPKSLLSLGEMLDEYICLKEQKVMVDRERVIVEQEKNRVQMLLQGMHNVMSAYNTSRSNPNPNVTVINAKSAVVPQPKPGNGTPPALSTAATTMTQNVLNIHSLPQTVNTNAETVNFSTPTVSVSGRKRKDTRTVDATSVVKKSRAASSSKEIPAKGQKTLPQSNNGVNNLVVSQPSSATQSFAGNCIASGSEVPGSSVVKCLFNQPTLSAPANSANSPVPKTPPGTNSCHSDTNVSPPGISSVATRNGEATPTCYSVVSTKRVLVSPAKQMAYIESSHCISPVKADSDKLCKRGQVRSRLDFDASDVPENLDKSSPNEMSTSDSDKEVDLSEIDFPDLDALGMDFSFTEMLNDLEIPCEGIDFSYCPASSHSKDNASGYSHECKASQVVAGLSSTTAEVLCEKDMNTQAFNFAGPDCLTMTNSVTKCITVISPVKKRQRSLDQENC